MSENKKMSPVALRLIYFAVCFLGLIVVGAIGYFKYMSPVQVFELNIVTLDVYNFIWKAFTDALNGGAGIMGFIPSLSVAAIVIYKAVLLVETVVFFIILLIETIILACKNRQGEDLEKAFHNTLRKCSHVVSMFLIYDCLVLIAGGKPDMAFYIEIGAAVAILLGNTLNDSIRAGLAKEEGKAQEAVFGIIKGLVVILSLAGLFYALTREAHFLSYFTIYSALMSSSVDMLLTFLLFTLGSIMKLVGFFLALSVIKRTLAYFPYDDKKDAVPGYSTNGWLGKSIAAFVLYLLSTAILFYVVYYTDYIEMVAAGSGALLLFMIIAIMLKAVNKAENPPLPPEEGEGKPEEKMEAPKVETPKLEEKPKADEPAEGAII